MSSFLQKKGFTLLEVLITIAVVGIILGAGITSYTRGLQNSRNNRRQVDMTKLRQALERYRSEDPNHAYPTSLNDLITSNILLELPRDPQTNASYAVQYILSNCLTPTPQSICSSYQLYIPIEPTGSQYILVNPNETRTVNSVPSAPTAIPTTP